MSFAGLRRRRRRRENVYVHSVYQASGRGWTGRRRRSAWKWYPKYKRSRQKPHFTGPTLLLSVIIITRLNFIFIPVCSPISYLRSSNLKSSNVTFVISVFVKSFFFSWNPSLILPSQIPLSLSLSLYINIYIYIYIILKDLKRSSIHLYMHPEKDTWTLYKCLNLCSFKQRNKVVRWHWWSGGSKLGRTRPHPFTSLGIFHMSVHGLLLQTKFRQ